MSCAIAGEGDEIEEHVRKLVQIFECSKVGTTARKVCETKCRAGVLDESASTLFTAANIHWRDVSTEMCDDPVAWGAGQTLESFTTFISEALILVFLVSGGICIIV